MLTSPNYPGEYPGGLECLHVIRASSGSPGAVVTLEVEDLELEPVRDLVLVRDGDGADAPALAVLSGTKVRGGGREEEEGGERNAQSARKNAQRLRVFF